jgi:hypothetical protein
LIDGATSIDHAGRVDGRTCFALDDGDDANDINDGDDADDANDANTDRPIHAGINPNVGWAKQVWPAMAVGMIKAGIPSDNAGAIETAPASPLQFVDDGDGDAHDIADRPIHAGNNPSVGRAKQVRPALAAEAIETGTPGDNVGAIDRGTCFAPT